MVEKSRRHSRVEEEKQGNSVATCGALTYAFNPSFNKFWVIAFGFNFTQLKKG